MADETGGFGEVGLHETRRDFLNEYQPVVKGLEQVSRLRQTIHSVEQFLGRVARDAGRDEELSRLVGGFVRERRPVADQQVSDGGGSGVRQQLLGRLHEGYDYFFRVAKGLGSANGTRQTEPGAAERSNDIEEGVLNAVARVYKSETGLPGVLDERERATTQLTQTVVENLDGFELIDKEISRGDGNDLRGDLDMTEAELTARKSILDSDPKMRAQGFRLWIREQIAAERKGSKIYSTPYYEQLISRAIQLGDKENGVGGKLYYGPPGTGKTEVGIEVNRREGFETRVVSIHYWTDFASLIGESPVSLRADKSTGYQQRITTALQRYKEMPADELLDICRDLAEKRAGEEGTARSGVETLLPYTIGVDQDSIKGKEADRLEAEQKEQLKTGFVRYLEAQALGASLGIEAGEDPMTSWINGEILIALDKGQRVLLDEIDKGGPNSLAGISHMLAKERGGKNSYIEIRDKRVRLPSWFSIDATSNEIQLDPNKQYLYDRFNLLPVGYPPPADELMIAAVKLSDGEGNILMSESEQLQVVNLYTQVLPEVRQLYLSGAMKQPFTLRGSKELCAMLVDQAAKRRTENSVRRAAEMVLLEQRNYGNVEGEKDGEEVRELLAGILTRSAELVRENPVDLDTDTRPERLPSDLRKAREKVTEAAMTRIISSPIARYVATEGVISRDEPFVPNVKLVKVSLSEEEADMGKKLGTEARERERSLKEDLGKGYEVVTELGASVLVHGVGGSKIQVEVGEEAGGNMVVKSRVNLPSHSEVRDVSFDGMTVVCERAINNRTRDWEVIDLRGGKATELWATDFGDEDGGRVTLEGGGRLAAVYTEDGGLSLVDLKQQLEDDRKGRREYQVEGATKRFSVSADGRFLLAEPVEGKSKIYDLTRASMRSADDENQATKLEPIAVISGEGYEFLGSRTLIRPGGREAVTILER